jgi:serine/threonine protein kinase
MSEESATIIRCSGCDAAMDVSELAPFTKVVCPECGVAVRVHCGFGPYTLVRRHAVGGMSMVFVAHDKTLDREVALKILSEEFSADERRIAAFEEEARLTASFSHPNVVRVFTTGRAFGRFFIAMELVPGGHFEHLIRERGRIPEAELLPLAIEVAQGLKAAHSAGLIHRDVKPGNILLDAEGHAKLVDFGLALVTQGGKARATELWATPYYVPPESVEGKVEDFRSDIYAFGATLYHALCGRPPCGEESMSTDILREAKKKVVPLGSADPSISKVVCGIVDRAMAYDPAARYASYDEMIADLAAAAAHPGTRRSSKAGRAQELRALRKRRQRLTVAAVAGLALAAVALTAWLATRRQPPVVSARPSLPEIVTPPDTPADRTAEISRRYRGAREAMEKRDYERAQQDFLILFQDAALQEPSRAWAGLEAVLAAFLDGRPAEARRLAVALRNHLRGVPGPHPLGGPDWRGLLEATDGFPPLGPPKSQSSAADLAAAMLAGLKNWEQGMSDPAAACFKAAAGVNLPPNERWAAIYQKLADAYLHDHGIISGPLFRNAPADRTACEAAIAQLDEALVLLQTRGRARFNVRAWQLDLQHRSRQAAAPETPAPGRAPELTKVLATLTRLAGERRLAEAAEFLRNLPGDPPGASRESLLILVDAAVVFLDEIEHDLERQPYSGELVLASGEKAVGLAIGGGGKLLVRSADGKTRDCAWTDLPADSLVTLHRALVKRPAGEIERLRRHESAIAFDWLAGDRGRALAAAGRLAAENPAFKQRWGGIAAGLP